MAVPGPSRLGTGADYCKGEENFAPYLEVDRDLIIGQNHASAVPRAQEVVKALS
ncbi:hypothetical protein [Streptomyces sp. SID12501]|uniref:hypothetical protein n=1 Tax=Streptomyces sp. SID12501 TaxID=2706042 RepID=UPI0031BA2947